MPSKPGSVKLKKAPASESCRITDSGHRHHRRDDLVQCAARIDFATHSGVSFGAGELGVSFRDQVGWELDFGEMVLPRLLKGLRQPRHALLSALAIPHGDLLAGEIDIFDAQPHTLQEPQTGTLEQARHEVRRAMELG